VEQLGKPAGRTRPDPADHQPPRTKIIKSAGPRIKAKWEDGRSSRYELHALSAEFEGSVWIDPREIWRPGKQDARRFCNVTPPLPRWFLLQY
jgi:hypothetical protein